MTKDYNGYKRSKNKTRMEHEGKDCDCKICSGPVCECGHLEYAHGKRCLAVVEMLACPCETFEEK